IGYEDGMNWYNYVGSDPVNARGPMGLKDVYCDTSGRCVDEHGNPVDPNSRLGPGDTVTFGGQTWHSDGIGGGYISYNIFRPLAPFGGGGDLSEGVREDTSSKRACKKVSGLLSNPAV